MSTYADVLQVALGLSSQERSDLADAMLESLSPTDDDDRTPPQLSAAWQAEIARRSAEIDAGTAKSFTWEETQQRARERACRDGFRRPNMIAANRSAALGLFWLALGICLAPFAHADEPWRPLPLIEEGQVAAGWRHVGFGKLVVDGDAVRTECDERGLGLAVWTKEKLGNCQIRVVFKTKDARSNAGVIIRLDDGVLDWVGKDSPAVRREKDGGLSPEMVARMEKASETEQGAWYAVHHGYEVQICDTGDALHRTGAVYSLAPAAEADKSKGEWRTMIITLDGNLVRVELDGKLLTTFDPASQDNPPRKIWHEPKREHKRPEAGYIGLQTHDPGDVVWFKEVSVRGLEK